jgi:hypothetical protein
VNFAGQIPDGKNYTHPEHTPYRSFGTRIVGQSANKTNTKEERGQERRLSIPYVYIVYTFDEGVSELLMACQMDRPNS